MCRICLLVGILLISCEKNSELNNNIGGEGVEFYLSRNALPFSGTNTNYNSIYLDTIVLQEEPFISYDQILLYDSAKHIFTVSFSKYNEAFIDLFKNPNNFIVTVDREPIIFGFFWSLIKSSTCSYVHLIEPYEQFDSENANELKLHFGYPTAEFAIGNDPRNNPILISRLKKDGKLKVF